MVILAMYDAVVSIEGGYEPYAAAIDAPAGADVRAAVATAGYVTARARIAASQVAALDQQYLAFMGTLPNGAAKTGPGGRGADARFARHRWLQHHRAL